MIPQTIEQMAALIYMMELNEWSTEISEKLCTKLANDSFVAASAFFAVQNTMVKMVNGLPDLQITKSEIPKGVKPRKFTARQVIETAKNMPGVTIIDRPPAPPKNTQAYDNT